MRKLSEYAPQINMAFEKEKFVVKCTNGHFKAVGADMALEQTINKSPKSTSGIIGCSCKKKNFVAKWELVDHEMLAICNVQRELSGFKTNSYDIAVNHEFSHSETVVRERNVQAILTFMGTLENPFASAVEPNLHNIITKEVMPEVISNQVLGVIEIVCTAFVKFRKERLVEKSIRFSEPIHRTNLRTFHSIHKPVKCGKGSTKLSQTKDQHCQQHIEVA